MNGGPVRETGRSNARRWTLTINNPGVVANEPGWLAKMDRLVGEGCVSYYIFGWEIGDSGTEHIQGYVELPTRKRLAWLKSAIDAGAHFEVARGTPDENVAYCSKDGSFADGGTPSSELSVQGRRSDLQAVKESLDAGCRMDEIADLHFTQYVKFNKAFSAYRTMNAEKRSWPTEVIIYYGDTGTGKSRKVHDDEKDLWVATDNTLKWFDGYDGHEAVLFDDFTGVKNNRFGFLLQLLDRYEMQVPIKCGFVNWAPRRAYFTSNLHLDDWFTGVSTRQFDALKRRVTKIVHFDGTWNP